MRFVETKRGTYEVMNDVRGLAIAVSVLDYADTIKFDEPSDSLTDSEIVARINALAD